MGLLRWTGSLSLGLCILGCGGVGDMVEDATDQVQDRVAREVERGVARGLGVPEDEVDIRREGDRWAVEVPHGQGDCAMGRDADDDGLPLKVEGLLARCEVTVDLKELAGRDVPTTVGNRFDVAARRYSGDPAAALKVRRKELEADGLEVHEVGGDGFSALVGMKGDRPKVAVAIGDSGTGRLELVAAPLNGGRDRGKGKGKGKRRRR